MAQADFHFHDKTYLALVCPPTPIVIVKSSGCPLWIMDWLKAHNVLFEGCMKAK